MPKNWRLALCTRWRPLASIIIVCLSLLITGIILFSVIEAVDASPVRRLDRRIDRIKVGMTIAELESILGPPDSTTGKVDRENLDSGKGGSDKIVEYRYSAEYRLSDSRVEYKGIFVDEISGRIVSIQLSWGGSSWLYLTSSEEWASLIAKGLMILVGLIVMLFFRTWCRSVTESEDSQEH
jgi:hypothetical protein